MSLVKRFLPGVWFFLPRPIVWVLIRKSNPGVGSRLIYLASWTSRTEISWILNTNKIESPDFSISLALEIRINRAWTKRIKAYVYWASLLNHSVNLFLKNYLNDTRTTLALPLWLVCLFSTEGLHRVLSINAAGAYMQLEVDLRLHWRPHASKSDNISPAWRNCILLGPPNLRWYWQG